MTLVVIISLFAAFFALAFVSRRRFGTLGLALASGALLANSSTVWLAAQFVYLDMPTGPLTDKAAASIVLTLLPALILLISGPSYAKKKHVLFGALAFAVMASMLVLPALTTILPNDDLAQVILPLLATYSAPALAITIALAVMDAWLTHNLPPADKKKHSS